MLNTKYQLPNTFTMNAKNFKLQSVLLYSSISILFLVDRIIKNFFIKNPATKQGFLFLTFSLTKNYGIAFGLPFNSFVLNSISFIFIIILLMIFFNIMNIADFVHSKKTGRKYLRIIIFLIFLSAISNFIDRILYGAVIDYIELSHLLSLNIADIMITSGFLIICFMYIFERNNKKKEEMATSADTKLVILSAPSGCGKNTIANILMKNDKKFEETISCTTRISREREINGIHYYFISENNFKEKIKNGEFIEWAKVHNKFYYGTLKKELSRIAQSGHIPLLVIDVQGGVNIKKIFPNAVLVFIKPNSLKNIESRIIRRTKISEEEIRARLETAKNELKMSKYYDHIITNPEGHPEKAAEELNEIINKYL